MLKWQTTSSKTVFENHWFRVRSDEALDHNGKPATYDVVELTTPSVFIIALDDQNQMLMQREYRYTIDREIWSIPAGHSEGDQPLDAAKRELLEETGLTSDDWTDLGELFSMVGIANCPAHLFIARNVQHASDERDPDEAIIRHEFMSFDVIDAMVQRCEIISTTTLTCIYRAKLELHV